MAGTARVSGRGRKPKPTAQKLLAGNPGKRAINTAEPDFTKVTHVDPPEWLRPRAAAMWEQMIVELLREGVLAVTDLHNVEAFCVAYDKWRMAEDAVQQHGILVEGAMGGFIKNPALTAANEALRQIAMFGGMLGLDPSSRQRIIGAGNKSGANEFDGLI